MKKIIIALSVISSSAVFAISDANLLMKCKEELKTHELKKIEDFSKVFEDLNDCTFKANPEAAPAMSSYENHFYKIAKMVSYDTLYLCENNDGNKYPDGSFYGVAISSDVKYNSLTGKCTILDRGYLGGLLRTNKKH